MVRTEGGREEERGPSASRTINRKSKQLLSSRVGGVLPPQLIELGLETLQPLAGFSGSQALHAGPPADTPVRLLTHVFHTFTPVRL